MAHAEQMYFFLNVKNFFPHFFQRKKVLEIGALNINGTVRTFFEDCDYTGIDIGPGNCVDVICKGEEFLGQTNEYDVVLSTEVFEHAENWDLIFLNMLRLVKPDGIIIFSCASLGRPQHGTRLTSPFAAPHVAETTDYYKNLTAKNFSDAFKLEYWFSNYAFVEDLTCLYFVGVGKRYTSDVNMIDIFKNAYANYLYKKHVLGLSHEYVVSTNG